MRDRNGSKRAASVYWLNDLVTIGLFKGCLSAWILNFLPLNHGLLLQHYWSTSLLSLSLCLCHYAQQTNTKKIIFDSSFFHSRLYCLWRQIERFSAMYHQAVSLASIFTLANEPKNQKEKKMVHFLLVKLKKWTQCQMEWKKHEKPKNIEAFHSTPKEMFCFTFMLFKPLV